MVIISKRGINQFIEKYPKSTRVMLEWYLKTKESDWANFADIRKVSGATDSVGNGLYVFNVGGNKFRLSPELFSEPVQYSFVLLEHIRNMTRLYYPTCKWMVP